ncbi:MAG: hypothetical protein EHM58_01170 [Ignavibacteriae bacterium]|nr:MAG: hypothetical protein EHM58_01170 [Ignavibacteriota bacterium]
MSHHYEIVDHEVVYFICKNNIPHLKSVITKMINELHK